MNLYETVEHLLRSNPNFVGENDEILKTKVSEAVTNLDPYLVKIFKNNDLTRQVFFQQLEDVWVLNQEKLKWVVNAKEFLEDSYTSYTNEIGLTNGGKFVSANTDVVLDFPYKDAVLVGGQDKDDQKRQEIMYHEIIAYDEITQLKAPKVFGNVRRYTIDSVEKEVVFKDDDNLIIKGNNYSALNSLLPRYYGKIQSIYIDPPYNRNDDSFEYNDKFNHSTWLTFMKNRLELAKKLLSDTGSIYIHIDDTEHAYLKVLCDEIFGRGNFLANIIWEKKTGSSDANHMAINTENILFYAKNIENVFLTKNPDSYNKNRYKFKDKYYERRGPYYLDTLDRGGLTYSDSLNYGIEMPDGNILYPNRRKEFKNDGWIWKWSKEKVKWGLENGFCEFIQDKEGNYSIRYKVYLNVNNEDEIISRSAPWKNLIKGAMNTTATNEQKELFGRKVFSTPKPEKLIHYLLDINTQEDDLVLDFFMGSATTQSVAMKKNRRFIGIEQMDYINTVSVPRLQKVIEGEQGGISKDVDWQGGGSFVYCELLEDGQRLIHKIQSASSETIQSVKDEIYHSEQIVPYILTSDLEKADKDFNALTLDEQKQALIGLIDKNKLYVNYSSIDDEDYQISKADKKFSRSFYEGGEVHD